VNAGTLRLANMVALNNNVDSNWTAAKINVKSAATLAMNVDSAGTNGFTVAKLNTLLGNISVANTAAEGLQAGAILGIDTSTATGGTFTQGNIIANSTGASGGAISLTKLGTGILVFDKANTYSGGTNVDAGTLLVNNITGSGTGSGTVTVAVGATLGGSGTISGDTIINGIHSPGNSPGIINHTNLTYNGGAIVPWELIDNTNTGRGTNFDGINVTGVLTFNGATTLSLDFQHTPAGTVEWNDTFWDLNYTGTNGWLVYDGANPIVGFDNLTLNAPGNWLDQNGDTLTSSRSTGNFFLFHDTTNNDIYLNFVPEPSTTLLGGLGVFALLLRRRRA
jgi:autotransporter-associated beta strand protein